MSTHNYKTQLLVPGEIERNLHYGPFAINWWYFLGNKNKQICFPLRINMRIKLELNQREFVIRVVHNTKLNNSKPGYICESDEVSEIYSSPSEVVNETYSKYFKMKTRYSGPSVLGFDNETIAEQLQVSVPFFPFKIVTNNLTIFVASIWQFKSRRFKLRRSWLPIFFFFQIFWKTMFDIPINT